MKNLTAALCLLFFLALPSFGQEGEKLRTKRVAILQVVDLTEAAEDRINAGVKLFVRNSLASAITNTPGYEGYDRVNLSEISGEQRFQHSGAVKDDDIRKIGEATGAEYVLIIEMARFDRNTFAISAKIIDVETLKMEGITPILSGMEPKDIKQATAGIAAQLLKKPKTVSGPGREKEAAAEEEEPEKQREYIEVVSKRENEKAVLEKRQKEKETAAEETESETQREYIEVISEREEEKEELERQQQEREAARRREMEREKEELEKRQREREAVLEKEREREELERRQKEALEERRKEASEKQQEELEVACEDPEGTSSTNSGTRTVVGQDSPEGKMKTGASAVETGAVWKPEAGSEKKPDQFRVLLAPQYSLPVAYGVMAGIMKKAGGYLRIKSNLVSAVAACNCDRSGRIGGNKKLWFTGTARRSRWALTGGYVRRLAKPLYLYLGAGYAESLLFWDCTDYHSAGMDEFSFAGVAAESGMMLFFGRLAVTIGAQTTAFKTLELNVGIGLWF